MIDPLGLDVAIDWADPVDRTHPLNLERLAWWLARPERMGGPRWLDLIAGAPGTLSVTVAHEATAVRPSWGRTTRPGGTGQLNFDGYGGYCPVAPAGPALTNWTVGAWFYAGGGAVVTTLPVVLQCGAALFQFTDSGTTPLYLSTAGTYDVSAPTGVAAANQWHRLIWTGDGTTARLYLDGAFVLSGASTSALPMPTCIGWFTTNDDGRNFWAGALDDIFIAARTWSPARVAADYAAPRQGYPGALQRVGPSASLRSSSGTVGAAATGVTLSDTFHYGPDYSGFLASFGYTVTDSAGIVRVARTNAGVTELTDAAGDATTGAYQVSFVADLAWAFPLRVKTDITGIAREALQSTLGTDYALVRAAADISTSATIADVNLVRVLGAALPTPNLAGYLPVDVAKVLGLNPDTGPDTTAFDAITVEAGLNARQALAVLVSAVIGQLAGAAAAGGTIVTKTPDGSATRATVICDAQGNRSSVTLNPPA